MRWGPQGPASCLPLAMSEFQVNYTRRTWVFGFDRTHLDADASVGKVTCSGATAALLHLVLDVNADTLKAETPCATSTIPYRHLFAIPTTISALPPTCEFLSRHTDS